MKQVKKKIKQKGSVLARESEPVSMPARNPKILRTFHYRRNQGGQTHSKGPFLLEQVPSARRLYEVYGIPSCQLRTDIEW